MTFFVSFPSADSGPSQWPPGTNQCRHWVMRTPNYSPGYTNSLLSSVSSLEVKDAFFFFSFFAEIIIILIIIVIIIVIIIIIYIDLVV